MSFIDRKGNLLTKAQILQLAETDEGKKQIFEMIIRARTAMATQRVLERLDLVPDEQTQQDVCLIIFHTCFSIPIEQVMEYVDSIYEYQEDAIHEC